MKVTASLLSALLAFVLLLGNQAGRAEEEKSVSVQPIRNGLYLLQGRGGNVLASTGPDGVLLVDDDYAEYHQAYADALSERGHKSVRFLINTHWHGDHTGGNGAWGGAGSIILAHDNVRNRMSTEQHMTFLGQTTPPSPQEALPTVTFESSLALHFNGDTVEVQHYPAGHTDGDSVVFFQKSNVVHLGDHFFKDRFPFVDLDSGGTINSYIRNVAALIQLVDKDAVIVPGHGSLANRSDLQAFHNMLINTRAEVQAMRADGLNLNQMQERGLDARWESWGGGFINEDRWIALLAMRR